MTVRAAQLLLACAVACAVVVTDPGTVLTLAGGFLAGALTMRAAQAAAPGTSRPLHAGTPHDRRGIAGVGVAVAAAAALIALPSLTASNATTSQTTRNAVAAPDGARSASGALTPDQQAQLAADAANNITKAALARPFQIGSVELTVQRARVEARGCTSLVHVPMTVRAIGDQPPVEPEYTLIDDTGRPYSVHRERSDDPVPGLGDENAAPPPGTHNKSLIFKVPLRRGLRRLDLTAQPAEGTVMWQVLVNEDTTQVSPPQGGTTDRTCASGRPATGAQPPRSTTNNRRSAPS